MIAPIADAVAESVGYQRPDPGGDDPNFPVSAQTAAMNIKSPYIQGQRRRLHHRCYGDQQYNIRSRNAARIRRSGHRNGEHLGQSWKAARSSRRSREMQYLRMSC